MLVKHLIVQVQLIEEKSSNLNHKKHNFILRFVIFGVEQTSADTCDVLPVLVDKLSGC